MSHSQDSYVFWEPEHNHRGTLNIFITCLSTLIICVWGTLHLSIPCKRRNRYQKFGVKVLWVTIGLLFPEALVWVALRQRRAAARIRDLVNDHFAAQQQSLMVWQPNMRDQQGGDKQSGLNYNRTRSAPLCDRPSQNEKCSVRRCETWTLVHGYYVVMGGIAYHHDKDMNHWTTITGIGEVLGYRQDVVVNISSCTINSQSKTSGLASTVLVVQAGWFCVSCLHRRVQGLPLTLLELSTIAHIASLAVAYIVWWDKPLNIQEPTIIPGIDTTSLAYYSRSYKNALDMELNRKFQTHNVFKIPDLTSAIAFTFSGFVYGAFHTAAWNNHFATHAEKTIWRISSCIITASPACFFASIIVINMAWKIAALYSKKHIVAKSLQVSSLVFPFAYIIASLYLTAESARQLFHLPPDAFRVPSWTTYFPHFV